MLELILKLNEWIIKLLKERENYSKEIFNQFYRPIYEELIPIHNDYLFHLSKIRYKMMDDPSKEELIEFIKSARSTFAATRQHILRGQIGDVVDNHYLFT